VNSLAVAWNVREPSRGGGRDGLGGSGDAERSPVGKSRC